jgi:tetratricopeptide (TPR) repeat protein
VTADDDARSAVRAAMLLERAGRVDEAEVAYEALLARWPDLPDSWYNLGVLQRRARRFDAALASYGQALARGVDRPEEVHLNRGVIYADHLRQDDAAERELNAALALNPAYVPALFNLANLNEDLGRRDQALAAYERLLVLDPHNAEALARYASLRGISGIADPLAGRLAQAIADPGATPADRASLAFALGKSLDACGAYDQAFAAYATANQQSRASAGGRGAHYDRQGHERFVDALIATFTRERLLAVQKTSAARPIFICGMFRSGSTLAEQVLAAHPHVRAGGELDFLPTVVHTELAPFPSAMSRVATQQLAGLAARYLETLSRLFPGATHVTDKRPDNFLYLGLVKCLFPEARIVHTTRNPLDNCLSIYFLHLDHGMGYALDLADIAHYYLQYRRLMAHWKSLFGADILDFDYDEFVREPTTSVAGLLDFCGLDWDEGCMDFQRADRAVKTASVWQVREPLYQRSSGRWRNYERHLAPLREALGNLVGPPESA